MTLNPAQFNHDFSGLNPEYHDAADVDVENVNSFLTENRGRRTNGLVTRTQRFAKDDGVYHVGRGNRPMVVRHTGSDLRWYSSHASMVAGEYDRFKASDRYPAQRSGPPPRMASRSTDISQLLPQGPK